MKRWIAVLLLCGLALAQQPAQTGLTFTPTELQHAKLDAAQARAQEAISRSQFLHLQATMVDQESQQKVQVLYALCETVRKENKWPEGTNCDVEKLTFTAPPPKSSEPVKPAEPLKPTAVPKQETKKP